MPACIGQASDQACMSGRRWMPACIGQASDQVCTSERR